MAQEDQVLRDDGHSGTKLQRPGLDGLRDQAARGAFDGVLLTAAGRLGRNYVLQMVVLEDLDRRGVAVVFMDRPRTNDPYEPLVTQIRGAVAEKLAMDGAGSSTWPLAMASISRASS